ncbi:glycerol-3-phosphate responsive antiterminator [Paenibacillus aurantius]|uniref:Glycerol uptake operon antiterminator regulatory protein n=1 Tax=Paenibacillus aurantius TaxID=2918900 RepID=A0AA96RJJ0_9BACL|nr:glycerol-3-phosphate responsive antiterminator [Paenibacillus aurantius]WJH32922.1 glycerol-3-phosphate responsive antiterminator [Paenibacillus sp. CC-CFT747]WNQ13334.1 glycerol-3-phosphate responsive antiterminator [Paenibacillus aurantius]
MYPIVDLVEHQVICAVQKPEDLEAALKAEANIVFLLTGSIFNVKELVQKVLAAGKEVFLHMEFIEGIAADRSGVAYVARHVCPTGIISTRSNLIRFAKDMDLMAIQRIFLIDRNAVTKGIKAVEQSLPDAIEVMPGIMPRIIREMTNLTPLPIIAGGLVGTRQEIDEALEAGALAVSVGSHDLWETK